MDRDHDMDHVRSAGQLRNKLTTQEAWPSEVYGDTIGGHSFSDKESVPGGRSKNSREALKRERNDMQAQTMLYSEADLQEQSAPEVQFEDDGEVPEYEDPSPYTCPVCRSENVELSPDNEQAHCLECLTTGDPDDFGWKGESHLEMIRRRPPAMDLPRLLWDTAMLMNQAAAARARKHLFQEVA
jgi:hypothetical protein